jgi:hypothetical protein
MMPHSLDHIPLKRFVFATLLAVSAGCRPGDNVGVAAKISVVSGADQVAPVGTGVETSPIVQVTDDQGNALRGVSVHFAVGLGGGTVVGDSAVTDADGRAAVGEWILGTSPGTNTLTATVRATVLTATVTATGVAGGGVSLRSSGQQGFIALIGQAVSPAPAVLVLDSFGNPVSGVSVTFTASQGGGSVTGSTVTTGSNGVAQVGAWHLGGTPGFNVLTARLASGPTVSFTAQALTSAPQLTATSPSSQAGFLNFPVPSIPRVQITTATGVPLSGVPVTFTTTGGDAVVSGGVAISNANGIASPDDWRLRSNPNSTVIATAALGATPVTFTATGAPASFLIDVRFLTSMSPDVRDAFVTAALRWMRIITTHLTGVPVNLPANACAESQPAMNEDVTDIVIFANVSPIDGPGNILGAAGPCAVRSTTQLPVVGSMQFDSADLQTLVNSGQIVATITHEMAHVLGFGTIWGSRGLTSGSGGADPIFIGPATLAMWPPFGTSLNYTGQPVPLENCPTCGAGTRDVHWREAVFEAELMTGFIESSTVPMPLSKLTIASLKDLGYQVDFSQADLFAGNLRSALSVTAPPTRLNESVGRATWEITASGGARKLP